MKEGRLRRSKSTASQDEVEIQLSIVAHLPIIRHMGKNKKLATPVITLGKVKSEVIFAGDTPSDRNVRI
jgi:hypothetical protein